MSDVIRNVVIRIALEQEQSQLKTPDITPLLQAQQKVTDAAKKQAQDRTNAEAQERLVAIAQHEGYYAALRRMMQEEAERGGQMISRQRTEQSAAWKAAEEQAKTAFEVQSEGWKKTGSAVEAAASIIHQLGRAYALTGLAQDGLTDKALKVAAAVEGGWASWQAGKEIVGALATKTGVWGVVIAGVLATATALYKVLSDIEKLRVDNSDEGRRGARLDEAQAEAKRRNAMTPYQQKLEDQQKRQTIQNGGDTTDDDKKAILDAQRREDEKFAERIRTAGQRFKNRDLRRGEMGEQDQLADLDKERADLRKVLNEQQGAPDAGANRIEKERVVSERLKEIEKERDKILKSQQDSLQKQVTEQQRAVELAKQRVEQEKKMVEATEERLGSLSELEFAEAKALAAKIKGGNASREDLLRAKQLGLEDQFGDEIRGGLGFIGGKRREELEGLGGKKLRGEGSDLDAARDVLFDESNKFLELEKALDEAAKREEKQAEKLKAAILRWIEAREQAQDNAFGANRRAQHDGG